MRRTLWQRLDATARAREACLLAGRDPDAPVAGYIVDATGRRHWCRKARWRWYAETVAGTPAPLEAQDNGPHG